VVVSGGNVSIDSNLLIKGTTTGAINNRSVDATNNLRNMPVCGSGQALTKTGSVNFQCVTVATMVLPSCANGQTVVFQNGQLVCSLTTPTPTTTPITTPPPPVNAACGSATNTTYTDIPLFTDNFCSSGITGAVAYNFQNNQWDWSCISNPRETLNKAGERDDLTAEA
jgi:hypothetical protein